MVEQSLAEYQEAFLLLQILGSEEQRLQKSMANAAFKIGANRRLGLGSTAAVNAARARLVPRWITASKGKTPKGGRAEYYELTEEGRSRLRELDQYPEALQIPGRAINRLRAELLQRAQPASASALERSTAAAPDQGAGPGAEQAAEELLLGLVASLHREKHSRSGLVPIHELRAAVRQKSPADAQHEVFDPRLKALWRAGRFGLMPLSDLSEASQQQLADSIPGVGQTLYYVEVLP